MVKRKIVDVEKGEKFEVKSCPKCNDELVVIMKDNTEVFKCKNCKFVKKK